jgi:hypothetical protein
MVLTHL